MTQLFQGRKLRILQLMDYLKRTNVALPTLYDVISEHIHSLIKNYFSTMSFTVDISTSGWSSVSLKS